MNTLAVVSDVEKLTGWKPPVIYDALNDAYRVATQQDVDRLMKIANAHSVLLSKLNQALEDTKLR